MILTKKNTTGLKYKSYSIIPDSIKVDDGARLVEGYFNSFNFIDSDQDKLMPGAFQRSIESHGPASPGNRKIAHLAYHDLHRPVGKLVDLKEDQFGLFFRSRMGTHTDGDDALRMYKEAIITEHSIGFNYIPDKIKIIENTAKPELSHYEIHEVKLWEGSYVVFGSNEETPNLVGGKSIKSIDDRDDAMKLLYIRQEKFVKALVDGDYSEKFNNFAEYELRQIFKTLEELARWEPEADPKQLALLTADQKRINEENDSLFKSIKF